ncbi:MAG: RNA methyltransferase [Gemmatimonadaceae bacterium]|nr:RNA methyltransferase [Chitinophagaceae bacterium]
MITKSQVKYIQSLGQKKVRDEEGVFVAEGPKIINELLQTAHIQIQTLYASAQWLEANQAILKFTGRTQVEEIKDHELEKISFLSSPSPVLALVKKPAWSQPVVVKQSVVLLLDGIQDPGNLGTIIRTADWFGITEIVCTPDCADCFAPKVVQSTMGSIARIRVHYAEAEHWLDQTKGVPVYVTVLGGKPLSDYGKIAEGIIVIGNESRGVSDALVKKSDAPVTIPRTGSAESLNAAVATGIVLSHLI